MAAVAVGAGKLVDDAGRQRHRFAVERDVAEVADVVSDLGQAVDRHAEQTAQLFIPLQGMNVEQRGARGRVIVGEMPAAQVEQEEGVHGAEPQATALRQLHGPRRVVHQPAHLAGGEVGIERQAGFRHHQRLDAFAFQALDLRLGALILPNDGVVQRQAAVGVPASRLSP